MRKNKTFQSFINISKQLEDVILFDNYTVPTHLHHYKDASSPEVSD